MKNKKENKKEEEGKNIFEMPTKDTKKKECSKCSGNGKIEGKSCPDCGGSGSMEDINVLKDVIGITKGKPQSKFEVIISDKDTGKVMYKKEGYGGILSVMDKLDKFSGKVVEGDYQNAMWGNPLIQRFCIDRVEEEFAKHIEEYVEAMEDTGLFLKDKTKLKQMLVEGNIKKMFRVMRNCSGKKPVNENGFASEPIDMKNQNRKDEFVKIVKETINKETPNAIIVFDLMEDRVIAIQAAIHRLSPESIMKGVLEFIAIAGLEKTKPGYGGEDKRNAMLIILKQLEKGLVSKE